MSEPAAAQLITRGVCRALRDLGYGTLTEFRVGKARRVDVIGLNRDGEFVAVEVKSSATDFRADGKWPDYLLFCDRFYFAVAAHFPRHILPVDCGLMVADGFGAAVVRPAPALPMHPTRRRAQIVRFALAASTRLDDVTDPRHG